jgi:hypothetical protein
MIRWLIVVFIALLLINSLTPWLQKLGFGKLPGDFRFRLFGREWFFPLASTLILSAVCALVAKIL